jgi:hypothetical protein
MNIQIFTKNGIGLKMRSRYTAFMLLQEVKSKREAMQKKVISDHIPECLTQEMCSK